MSTVTTMGRPQASVFLVSILVIAIFSSCEQPAKPVASRTAKAEVALGGALRVAVSELPPTVLPSSFVTGQASEIGLHLHRGLLSLDPVTLKLIPGIAETWSVDKEGASYVFNLRKGVRFHTDPCFKGGSREVTAYDFLYSFRQLCIGDSASAFESTFKGRVLGADAFSSGNAESIEGVMVIDDYTLRIKLLKPDPSFLFVLAQPSTAVIPEEAVAAYNSNSRIGTGPFMFAASDDSSLTLLRNFDYYDIDAFDNRLPYVDTLVFRYIGSKQQQLEAFFSDELDLISGLFLDPVRDLLEEQIAAFTGRDPEYILRRDAESVGYESYSVYRSEVKGLGNNFMGYRDFSQVQVVR